VDLHHGDLRLESVPGDTRFQVRLPLTAPPTESATQSATQSANQEEDAK
jgi:nitrogen-specific signal transduction histidine kinase